MEKVFNKLVRDKIPDIIKSNNEKCDIRILNDNEFKKELYKKLLEEANEVIHAKDDEVKEELADTLEIIIKIAEIYNSNLNEIIELCDKKRLKKGSFDKKIFLVKTY